MVADVAHGYCGLDNCPLVADEVSSLTVVHARVGGSSPIPVEPDSGETIEVTAYWDALEIARGGCTCVQTATASVVVDVDWDDSTGWTAICTGCDLINGPIHRVAVCSLGHCASGHTIENGWSYELIVDIDKTKGTCGGVHDGYLSHVEYETTAVDDGNLINTAGCTEGVSVSPTSQTFVATDSSPFECNFTCAAASGPTMTITY